MSEFVYIGLGSNLDNPHSQLQRAINALANLADTQLIACSSFYQTAPIGPEQDDFLNAVVKLSTTLGMFALLQQTQAIEQAHRRVRDIHWGPRTLDLDILLYGEQVINSETLTIPHPLMHQRGFVLQPLAEIANDIEIPQKGPILHWLELASEQVVKRLEENENE